MKQSIRVGNQEVNLKVDIESLEEEELDTDKLTFINMQNLIGELITFSMQMNRLGFLLAKSENSVNQAKMMLEIKEAQFAIELRESPSPNKTAAGIDKGWTEKQVTDEWKTSSVYKVLRQKYNKKVFERDVVNSLYWAAKDKSEKLQKLSLTLNRSDLELNESFIINGIKVNIDS